MPANAARTPRRAQDKLKRVDGTRTGSPLSRIGANIGACMAESLVIPAWDELRITEQPRLAKHRREARRRRRPGQERPRDKGFPASADDHVGRRSVAHHPRLLLESDRTAIDHRLGKRG